MKVLVIGGNGFLGRQICKAIPNSTTYGRARNSKTHIKGDILELEKLAEVIPKFDVIINCVGLSPLKQPKKDMYSQIHVLGVRNILFSLKQGQRFIQISAIGADSSSEIEYLRTKGKAEEIIKSSKSNHLIIRPSIMFGKSAEIFKLTESLPFFPNIKAKVSPVYIGDVASIIKENLKKREGVIEVAGNMQMTMYEFVKKYKKAKKQIIIKIPKPVYSPFLYMACKLNLFGLSMNQYKSINKDNVSRKRYDYKYKEYEDWLRNL